MDFGIKGKLKIIKGIGFICAAHFSMLTAFPQNSEILLKSTLTHTGSATIFSSGQNKTLMLQQSIGQLGNVGTVPKVDILVQQGFLTNYCVPGRTGDIPELPPVAPLVYPNPVPKILNITFVERTSGPISVGVFDIFGRLVLSKGYDSNTSVELDLESLQDATYLLQIRESGHIWGMEIIKLNK